MGLNMHRSDRRGRGRGSAVTCVWLAMSAAIGAGAAPARGQCHQEELAKLIASDPEATDNFGFAVAVSGDTAVVGAYRDDHAGGTSDGSAYVFVLIDGVWTEQAKLTASDAAPDDQFGNSVAISGDTVVIGAHYDDLLIDKDNLIDAGSAYVFVRSSGVWTEQAKLMASDASLLDGFGFSVALSGDTTVIGSPYTDEVGGDSGSAYVFVRSGGAWAQQQKLTAADAFSVDEFGFSVAISDDTVVAGAHFDNHEGGPDAGSAYVFVRASGAWTQQQKLIASDAGEDADFGVSVAISGDTAVVGADLDDLSFSGSDEGSAYVFARAADLWTEQAKLTASDAEPVDNFGRSVGVSSDTIVVGSYLADHSDLNNPGAAYAFVRAGGVRTQKNKLTASDAADVDLFGWSVAVSDGLAIVGAWGDDHSGKTDAGSAYVFDDFLCVACDGDETAKSKYVTGENKVKFTGKNYTPGTAYDIRLFDKDGNLLDTINRTAKPTGVIKGTFSGIDCADVPHETATDCAGPNPVKRDCQ